MSKPIIFVCFSLFLSSTTRAFNLTRILSDYPEYSTFNELLNKTGVYEDINSRETTTVLVVQNDKIDPNLATRPLDVLKRILSTHIMLDYFDVPKIVQLSKKSTMVTNLYQSSGIANNNQGFLNITATPDNKIGFGSAVRGSPIDVKLEKLVMSHPYNISILQVSGIIYTPGIDGTLSAPPRKAPGPPVKKNDTSVSPSLSPSASDDDDDYAAAPELSTPAESPKASESPAPSESPKAADADGGVDDASPPSKSSGMTLCSGLLGSLVLALVSSLAVF